VLAAVKLLVTFSHLDAKVTWTDQRTGYMRLTGACTFVRLPILAEALEEVPRGTTLHIDLDRVAYIDHACLDLLMNWSKQHEETGGELVLDWDSVHSRVRSNVQRGSREPRTTVKGSPAKGDLEVEKDPAAA